MRFHIVRPHYARRLRGLAPLLAACCASAAGANAPPVTLVELLRTFEASGNEILYSTDLVPPNLTAPADTHSPDLLSRVVEALVVHHLQLKKISDHRYIVTRETPIRPQLSSTSDAGPIRPTAPLSALEEVLVFASHYTFASEPDGGPSSFDHRAIEQLAGTQNDALRAARTAPGVASTYSARPYIRGGTADDVLVRFDGVTLINPFHFREFQSLLSPFIPADVERIDIYSGGFPVRFGTRSAGVIDVVPRSVSAGYDLRAGASRLGIDLSGAGRMERWPVEWLASVRRSPDETNILQPIDANPSDPVFLDALARVRWTANPDARVTVGWLLLNDNARARADAIDEVATSSSRDEYAWLAWEWFPTAQLQSHSSLTYTQSDNGHFGRLRLAGVADGSLIEDHKFRSLAARSEWAYAPNDALLWNVGAEFTSESAELRYLQNQLFTNLVVPSIVPLSQETVDLSLNPRSSTSALFASVRHRWRALEAEMGVRLDSQDYRGFGMRSQFTPRLNLRYDPANDWHVYASWGEFSQAQRVDEFREEENQLSPDAANRASHAVVGISHEPAGTTRWRIEMYRNHWSSVSAYEINALGLVTLLPELQPDRIRIAPLSSESDGIELSARRSIGVHCNLWGTYTLSRVIDELPSGDVPRSWDQRQAANLGLSWNTPKFTASIILGWHSGWPRTSISAVTRVPGGPSYLLLGTPNSLRWGDYLSADMHVSRNFHTRLGELSLWLDVTNATNRSNNCCTELAPVVPPAALPTWLTDSWAGRGVNLGFSWRLQKEH